MKTPPLSLSLHISFFSHSASVHLCIFTPEKDLWVLSDRALQECFDALTAQLNHPASLISDPTHCGGCQCIFNGKWMQNSRIGQDGKSFTLTVHTTHIVLFHIEVWMSRKNVNSLWLLNRHLMDRKGWWHWPWCHTVSVGTVTALVLWQQSHTFLPPCGWWLF